MEMLVATRPMTYPISAGPREAEFRDKLGSDLRHLLPHRGVRGWIPWVDRAKRGHQDRSGGQPAEPFVVGRHDVPWRPRRAGVAQHAVEGPLVVVPVASLPDIAGRELPVLLWVVDPLEKPFGLLPP